MIYSFGLVGRSMTASGLPGKTVSSAKAAYNQNGHHRQHKNRVGKENRDLHQYFRRFHLTPPSANLFFMIHPFVLVGRSIQFDKPWSASCN